MLDIKKWMAKVTSNFVTIHRIDASVASSTIAGNARSHFRVSNVVPSNAVVLGIIVNATPNNDWFRTMAYMDGRDVIIRYHNEYTGALTGSFNAVVSYAVVGGVAHRLLKALKTLASERRWVLC